jgi:hypothetical protein
MRDESLDNSKMQSMRSEKATGVVGILDPLREKVLQLLKKLRSYYKQAAKIDSAYEGTLSLMKGWVKSTGSNKRGEIEQLIGKLEAMKDAQDFSTYKEKIISHKILEEKIVSSAQNGLKSICEAVESDIRNIEQEIINKSKKLSYLKVEMDKVEPGKQIPATLRVDPDLPK